MSVNIVLIDDHDLFREGLKSLLQRNAEWRVTGEAGSGPAALSLLGEPPPPDLVILDLKFPGGSGLSLARWIRERLPSTRVLVLTGDDDLGCVAEVLQAGADGFLRKHDPGTELVRAIETVLAGKTFLCADAATALAAVVKSPSAQAAQPGPAGLGERDREILRCVAEGLRNKEIAIRLGVSVKTVETLRSRLMVRLGVESSAELVRYAVRHGIASP